MNDTPLAFRQHNHQHCIDSAIATARTLCRQRGVKLTPLREGVLKLVWQSHKPLGAYALMGLLEKVITRRVAPPTVYRALDFLTQEHLIHKIHSLNAFVGCPEPEQQHQTHFLICQHCHQTLECGTTELKTAIQNSAQNAGFVIEEEAVEILGTCPNCSDADNDK